MTAAHVPEPAANLAQSVPAPDFIQPDDLRRFGRLMDRTLGVGFKLVVIEAPEPRERQTVLKWLQPQFVERQVVEHDIDLVKLLGPRSEWPGGSANFWAELTQAVPPTSVANHRAALVVSGFEELMDHTGTADWDIVRQFNIQRDLFVRDYPCWWVLLIHPASRHHWLNTAPDFSDFVALWIEAPLRVIVLDDVAARDLTTSLSSDSSSSSDRADWPEPLRLVDEDICAARFDAALDRIHSFRAATISTPQTQRDLAIADLLESDVVLNRGETEAALKLLRDRVHPVLQRLVKSDPANVAWQRDLSVALEKLGDVATRQGDLAEAERHFRSAFAIREVLSKAKSSGKIATLGGAGAGAAAGFFLGPLSAAVGAVLGGAAGYYVGSGESIAPDPERQRDLSVSFSNLGDLATAQGNLLEAQRYFSEAFRIRQHLAESDPANVAWQRDLSVSFNTLGGLAAAQGNLPDAQRLFSEALRIRQRLAESDPANAAWQRDLSVSFNSLGDLATAQGNLPEAERLFGEQLGIARRLAESDPANAAWQRDLSVSLNKHGDLATANGNLTDAHRLFGEAIRTAERLAESDPANALWQRDLSVSFEKLGNLAVAEGNLPEAQRLFGESLRIAQRLAESDPANAEWQRDLWVSYWRVANAIDNQQSPDANMYWRKACDTLAAIEKAGLFVSPQDQKSLTDLRDEINH